MKPKTETIYIYMMHIGSKCNGSGTDEMPASIEWETEKIRHHSPILLNEKHSTIQKRIEKNYRFCVTYLCFFRFVSNHFVLFRSDLLL